MPLNISSFIFYFNGNMVLYYASKVQKTPSCPSPQFKIFLFLRHLSYYNVHLKCKTTHLPPSKIITTNGSHEKNFIIPKTKLNGFFSRGQNNNFIVWIHNINLVITKPRWKRHKYPWAKVKENSIFKGICLILLYLENEKDKNTYDHQL